MGQYAIKPVLQGLAWLTAGTIAVLNLKLSYDAIAAWMAGAGGHAWLLWVTVVPGAAGLVALLGYVTVVPWIERRRGAPTPTIASVHGPTAMPAVKPGPAARRIAAAVDFSGADTAVLSHAVTLARSAGRGASVLLLHVVESGGARIMGDEMHDSEARGDQQRLELYRNELAELGVEATYDLGFGNPADQLIALIQTHKPDLVVLGSHGHRAVADFVHGTTVERLRHHVRVPVLVVPGAA